MHSTFEVEKMAVGKCCWLPALSIFIAIVLASAHHRSNSYPRARDKAAAFWKGTEVEYGTVQSPKDAIFGSRRRGGRRGGRPFHRVGMPQTVRTLRRKGEPENLWPNSDDDIEDEPPLLPISDAIKEENRRRRQFERCNSECGIKIEPSVGPKRRVCQIFSHFCMNFFVEHHKKII